MTEPTDTSRPGASVRASSGTRDALVSLRSRLEADLDAASVVRDVAESGGSLAELRGDLDIQLDRARKAAVVCLVGSTGAGKSTLLNALVGREVAKEGIDRPTTSAPVIYRPVDADVSEILAGLPGKPPHVVTYDVEESARIGGGSAFWRGQILIDAPDVNSVATVHRDVVKALSSRSDVLVVVAHRQSIAELSSATFVDLFAERRGMVFVLGRRDELDPASQASLVEQLSELRSERWRSPDAPVLTISAREGKADPEAGGIAELRAVLSDLIKEEKLGSVRRRNAVGNVARIASLGAEIADGSAQGFDDLSSALSKGAVSWCGFLVGAIHERLDVRHADLTQMLWNDAAKVWDGPGGYALRVGGLSALGLGAGAAVARRNPVLAAGLAVGSIAADRVRGAVRERQFESTSGLLPAASEIEAFQRDSFVAARLAADDLFVETHAAQMTPSESELDGHASRAVDEAWDRIVRVDLPREARRGVPAVLRWLIDLPVYALGVFVLYRVVEGFFRESYVGLDFIMSALIIGLGWLFLARILVRTRLGSKSKSLLEGVRGDIEQRIGAAAQAAIEGRLDSLRTTRDALDHIAKADQTWRSRLHGEQ